MLNNQDKLESNNTTNSTIDGINNSNGWTLNKTDYSSSYNELELEKVMDTIDDKHKRRR